MSRIEDDIDEKDDDEDDEDDNLSSEGLSSNKKDQKSKWNKTRKTYRLETSDYLTENLSVDNIKTLDNEIFVEKSPKGRFGRVKRINNKSNKN
jgi:hypothetical protein